MEQLEEKPSLPRTSSTKELHEKPCSPRINSEEELQENPCSPSASSTKELQEKPRSHRTGTDGSRAALDRLRAYRSKERRRLAMELDELCSQANTAHAGLRLYLLITTPKAPVLTPPATVVIPLLTNRTDWLLARW
nr:uncharacterized protein LOC128692219 [Cherax quadricarinatus]